MPAFSLGWAFKFIAVETILEGLVTSKWFVSNTYKRILIAVLETSVNKLENNATDKQVDLIYAW